MKYQRLTQQLRHLAALEASDTFRLLGEMSNTHGVNAAICWALEYGATITPGEPAEVLISDYVDGVYRAGLDRSAQRRRIMALFESYLLTDLIARFQSMAPVETSAEREARYLEEYPSTGSIPRHHH